MKQNKFSLIFMSVLLLASCGNNNSYSKDLSNTTNIIVNNTNISSSKPQEGKTIILTYSGTASDKNFNENLFEDFKIARKAAGDPNTYIINYEIHNVDTVDSEVINWSEGPDVYEFASDKIAILFQKGVLSKLEGKYKTFIEEEMNKFGQEAAMFNNEYYAYPYTGDNTYYLQYDKSKLTKNDVSSIENLLSKIELLDGKFGYKLETAFWGGGAMFTYGADYNMIYNQEGEIIKVEADFDTDKGIKAAKAIYKIISHPVWQNDMEAPNEKNKLIACVAGTWEIPNYKNALGDNYACAIMPTVTIDGDTQHLGSFLGGKLFGVNPLRSLEDEDRLIAAHELAMFLSGKDTQLARFENSKTTPCHYEASQNFNVQADENVAVLSNHSNYAHVQSAVSAEFWSASINLISALKSSDFKATDSKFKALCSIFNSTIITSNK